MRNDIQSNQNIKFCSFVMMNHVRNYSASNRISINNFPSFLEFFLSISHYDMKMNQWYKTNSIHY